MVIRCLRSIHRRVPPVLSVRVEANPNFSRDYKEFSHNCQRVVVAYELLRRGYDVEALPTYKGDKLNTVPYSKDGIFHGRWRGAFQNAKTESVGASTGSGVMENITKKMQQYGNGARAVVQIFYNRGGGHVFNVENDNGRVVYIEAQAGKLKDRDMQELMTNRVRTGDVNIVRVDNLRISDRARNFVRPRKKK